MQKVSRSRRCTKSRLPSVTEFRCVATFFNVCFFLTLSRALTRATPQSFELSLSMSFASASTPFGRRSRDAKTLTDCGSLGCHDVAEERTTPAARAARSGPGWRNVESVFDERRAGVKLVTGAVGHALRQRQSCQRGKGIRSAGLLHSGLALPSAPLGNGERLNPAGTARAARFRIIGRRPAGVLQSPCTCCACPSRFRIEQLVRY